MEDISVRITTMDSILFVLILELALMQMRILEGSSELRALNWEPLNKAGRSEWDKLIRDREFVNDVLKGGLLEIAECGGYGSILQAVRNLQQQCNAAIELRLQFQKLHEASISMAIDLDNTRERHKDEIRETDMRIAVLQDNIKDDQTNANARLSYATKWLRANEESLELKHNIKPLTLPRADHETRVHQELVRAYELQIQERDKEQDYWRLKYADDTSEISKKVANKREKLEATVARRKDLESKYNLHAGEIRAWLTFKSERAARLAREKRLNDAAIRIQSWWRGVMVRRGLGQFKYLRNIKKTPNKNKKK